MKEETKKLLSIWIGVHPESSHALDIERFYDLVFNCLENGVIIDIDHIYSEIKNQKEWDEGFATKFAEEYSTIFSHITGFVDYLKEKHNINLHNAL